MNKKRQQLQQAAQTHKDNLRKSVQQRLEVARAKGDVSLVRQLEAEANYLA
ncbi:arginine synthesis PII-interacting regulator PirA [Roseofilum casamattae]|uniref:30S ribosomal protein S20 n=1 Tax=Roseofilum casamattae BLCC-M143 TaxID=3022442 RepID=A0ABT7BZY8_9CYAN|nr:hypothetical protein [Roseofilum casamattae]MDJ1184768.1 hypothetical protein [Roseofilum casamattae BLCC-M143]